jgi:hypothetical protein
LQYRCAKFIATRYLQSAGERNVNFSGRHSYSFFGSGSWFKTINRTNGSSMDQSIDGIAFYVLSACIFALSILSFFWGTRKASIYLASVIGIALVGFLLLGVVAKDIPGLPLPMSEIAIFFFGFLKALLPLIWVIALLHRGTNTPSDGSKSS